MTDVLDLIETLNNLNIKDEVVKAIQATTDEIAFANTDQLMHGTRSDGSMMPPYSPVSVSKYHKPNGPIRLYDTGAFHKSFKAKADSSGFIIDAVDLYDLEDRYGETIYGLNDLSQEFYNEEEFFPIFSDNIEQKTGLRFAK